MKTLLKALSLATVLAPVTLANFVSATPLPLQPGVYYLGASKSIWIAKKDKQYCYVGRSNQGVGYASLIPVTKHPNVYRLAGSHDLFVSQTSTETIAFGELKQVINNNLSGGYRLDSTVTTSANTQDNVDDDNLRNDPYLRRCFNSRKPFFIHIPNN